jgi:hypothetical protein
VHLNGFRRGVGVGATLIFIVLVSSSCLVRKRTVVPKGQPSNKPALTASRDELLERIHKVADPIQSFSLKVDMSPSVGGVFGGKVTDYPTIQGVILFRRPEHIRVVGLDPVVHSTILDMVSVGNDFHFSLPTKNEFFEGTNDTPATSKNKLENLRPIAFLNSLLIQPPRAGEMSILEDVSDETRAVYKLIFVQREGDDLRLLRSVCFDRYTLDIASQRTFDAAGHVTSSTKYSGWASRGDVRFPTMIDMTRPQDGYELVLSVTDFKLNPPDMTDDKFVLNPPPGAQIRNLAKQP